MFWSCSPSIASRLRIAQGIPLRCITQGAPPFVGPLPPPGLVASRPGLADLALLRFYDPSHFRAGILSRHSSRPTVKLEANPRADIVYWRFLDDWKDCFRWRSEHHASVTLYSDTSKTAWGGTLRLSGHTWESRDYCLDNSQHINVLDAQPLLPSLLSFREHLTFSGVDVHTGNRVLKSSLENGGCRSRKLAAFLKTFFIPAGNTISALMFTMFRR